MTKSIPVLRCIHRHTIEEHPNCFAQGAIKYEFKDDREWERLTGVPWYNYPEYKIGYLDIETTSLKANIGFMLTWCIKERDGSITHDMVTKQELFDYDFDRRITQSLVEEMKKYKILVGYNSTRFDFPFARSRARRWGIEFPHYGEIYEKDLYYTVRSKLRLHRSSLDAACAFLGIEGKTPINLDTWVHAAYGEPTALKEVLSHNKGDVEILEELHREIEPFRKWTRRSI